MVKTLPSNVVGGMRSLVNRLRPNKAHGHNIKQKQCFNKLNKDFISGPHEKIFSWHAGERFLGEAGGWVVQRLCA